MRRIVYLDYIRVLATVMVVALHVIATKWWAYPVDSAAWTSIAVLDSMVRGCVPLFFMLTGVLFLAKEQRPSLKKLWTRSIPRLVVVLALWSVFYLWFGVNEHYRWEGLRSWRTSLPVMFFHLWFLPAIIGVYIVLPLLWLICRDRTLAWYFVGVAMLSWAVGFGSALNMPLLTQAGLPFTPQMCLGYVAFPVLGYLLATTERSVKPAFAWAGAIGSGAMIAALTVGFSRATGHPTEAFFVYASPLVALQASCLFLACKGMSTPRLDSAIGHLSSATLGVYLIHPAVLLLLVSQLSDSAPWRVISPIILVLTLAISWAIAAVLHRIPLLGRYLA